jgi:hypothetical protein
LMFKYRPTEEELIQCEEFGKKFGESIKTTTFA